MYETTFEVSRTEVMAEVMSANPAPRPHSLTAPQQGAAL